ncbi:MAG: hypothetical protein KA739_00350 [Pseudomonadales bacterium]|nr:hypothetical protein [Pseudomonadales bacterium]MBP6229441.1 hypothetical protein [Pseudomonadales bacterium]
MLRWPEKMVKAGALQVLVLVFGLMSVPGVAAQPMASPVVRGKVDSRVLEGEWVRPDGGYRIVIRAADVDGRLDAMYFNPDPLPFSRALAVPDGAKLRVFFELRAGGYAGSTYDLRYDPASDRLYGIYYQAVAKQSFEVFFTRRQSGGEPGR